MVAVEREDPGGFCRVVEEVEDAALVDEVAEGACVAVVVAAVVAAIVATVVDGVLVDVVFVVDVALEEEKNWRIWFKKRPKWSLTLRIQSTMN